METVKNLFPADEEAIPLSDVKPGAFLLYRKHGSEPFQLALHMGQHDTAPQAVNLYVISQPFTRGQWENGEVVVKDMYYTCVLPNQNVQPVFIIKRAVVLFLPMEHHFKMRLKSLIAEVTRKPLLL
ncbi:MAG: hypothetical protein WCG98_05835 [bacterium]